MVAIINGDLPSEDKTSTIPPLEPMTDEGTYQRLKSHYKTQFLACDICKMNFIVADFLKYHAKVHLPMKLPMETLECWKPSVGQQLQITIKSEFDVHHFEFVFENKSSANLKLSSLILINELFDHAYLNASNLPFRLEAEKQITFAVEHDYFYLNNRNSLTVIYEDDQNVEYMQRYGFIVKASDVGAKSKLITEADNSSETIDDLPEMVLFKLSGYEPSPAIKSLVCSEFKPLASATKRELELLSKIMNYTPDQLNRNNYVDILSLMIEIEDFTSEHQMYRYDQHSANLIKLSSNLYKLPCNTEDRPFLMECDNVWLAPSGLQTRNNERQKRIYGFVRQCTTKSIFIKTTKSLDSNVRYRIHFLANRLPFRFEQQSLHLARDLNIIDLLFPSKLTLNDGNSNEIMELELFEKDITTNPEQNQAVRNIVIGTAYPAPYLLFGPPGTGKTKTLVEAICQILKTKPNSHILICALSNGACDEISARIIKYLDRFEEPPKMLRLYAPTARKETAHIDVINMSNYNRKKYPDLSAIYKYRVIVSTLAVAGRLTQAKIKTDHFTHLFIDECESASETVSLIPIAGVCSTVKKINAQIVLAGDPKQLGPVLKSNMTREKGHGKSMLERLMDLPMYQRGEKTGKYDGLVITKLVQNYRSHPAIFKFSNEQFYDDEMVAFGTKEKTHWATNLGILPSPEFPIIFESVTGETQRVENCPSCYNDEEIERVLFYIKTLLNDKEANIKQSSIGVVSPYKRQYWKLEKEFVKNRWFDIQAGSVETFQGQEKPVIIVTTTKSQKCGLGFLQDAKRLNVLLTRAEGLLIVIGNSETLSMDANWKSFIDYVKANNGFKNNLESSMSALKINKKPEKEV